MTPSDLAEAVRLALLVADTEATGQRHTVPGGYVWTIARALIAAVEEVDELRGMDVAATYAQEVCDALIAERDAAIARAEQGEAALVAISKAFRLGDYAAPFEYMRASDEEIANAAAQYDAASQRAERAEAALAGECETCKGEGVMYVGPVNEPGSEECEACGECLGSTKGWVVQAIADKAATERARVVEEIAADLDRGALPHDKATAAHIRATWGAKEQS